MQDDARLRSLRETIRRTGIPRAALLEAIRAGKLAAYRPGKRRILLKADDVAAWLEKHRVLTESLRA